MVIDVSDILLDPDFGPVAFTRRRPTSSLAKEGASATSYPSVTLNGIIQPATTKDAQLLPEGVRLSDVRAFFTSGDISAGNGSTQLPDLLQYGGETFRVLNLQDFGAHGMRKALAQRIAVAGGS